MAFLLAPSPQGPASPNPPSGPANWTGWWEDNSTTFCALINADLALTALANAPNTTLTLNLRCKANINGASSRHALPCLPVAAAALNNSSMLCPMAPWMASEHAHELATC